jgi:hypothetical protein
MGCRKIAKDNREKVSPPDLVQPSNLDCSLSFVDTACPMSNHPSV